MSATAEYRYRLPDGLPSDAQIRQEAEARHARWHRNKAEIPPCPPFRDEDWRPREDMSLGASWMPPALGRQFVAWVCGEFRRGWSIASEDRPVYITPYAGHYGLGGYILTVEGSPIRFTVLVSLKDRRAWIHDDHRCLKAAADYGATARGRARYQHLLAFIERSGLMVPG